MNVEIIIAIISGVLTGAVFSFIQFMIQRGDKKHSDIEEIKKSIEDLRDEMMDIRQGNARAELLLLLNDYPDNEGEVLKQAEKYFVQLKGDFYMTSLFTKWLQLNHITIPGWFSSGGKE